MVTRRKDWRFAAPKSEQKKLARHFAVLRAISASALMPTDRLVLRVIEDHADWETGEAYPGVRAMARESGLSLSSIERSLDRLKIAGWLEAQPRASPRGTTVYRVTPPVPTTGTPGP